MAAKRDAATTATAMLALAPGFVLPFVLTERLEFVPDQDAEFFAAVPAAPAVFLLRGDDPASDPYVSKTANLRRRLQRLLGIPTEQSKRLNLRDRVRGIEYSPTGSDFESGFLLYKLLRATFPQTYASRLRLRPSPYAPLSPRSARSAASSAGLRPVTVGGGA